MWCLLIKSIRDRIVSYNRHMSETWIPANLLHVMANMIDHFRTNENGLWWIFLVFWKTDWVVKIQIFYIGNDIQILLFSDRFPIEYSGSLSTARSYWLIIGGSKGEGVRTHALLLGVQILSISCIFGENLANRVLAPPPGGLAPHVVEILDPPMWLCMHMVCSYQVKVDACRHTPEFSSHGILKFVYFYQEILKIYAFCPCHW